MTSHDLLRKLHDPPFRPFRIKMVNNTVYEILEPWMIMVGESSAIIVTQSRQDDRGYKTALDWRTISVSQVVELSDAELKQSA